MNDTPRSCFAVLRVRGPAWDESLPMRAQDGWPEHAHFMDQLAADAFVILGGPLGDGRRILLVCEAADENAVRARLAADPWSTSGVLELGHVDPWTILLDAGAAAQSS